MHDLSIYFYFTWKCFCWLIPIWSSGQDSGFSPRWPDFDSRYGKGVPLWAACMSSCVRSSFWPAVELQNPDSRTCVHVPPLTSIWVIWSLDIIYCSILSQWRNLFSFSGVLRCCLWGYSSVVEHLAADQEVSGSNLGAPFVSGSLTSVLSCPCLMLSKSRCSLSSTGSNTGSGVLGLNFKGRLAQWWSI